MKDLDLTGVDPMRRQEIRRRVNVINDFLAIAKPTATERESHARLLDLGTKSFMRLVAVWKAHGDARQIDTAATKGGKRPRAGGIGVEARQAVRDAAIEQDADLRLISLTARVAALCDERGVAAPSKSAVWSILREERLQRPGRPLEPGIVIGRVAARLPVQSGEEVVYPLLDVAVEMPEGQVLDWAMAVGGEPDRAGLAARVHARWRAPHMPVEVAYGPAGARRAAHLLASLLGNGPASLKLLYRPASARPAAALTRSRRDAVLTPEDAKEFVRSSIERHNAERVPGASATPSSTRPVDRAGDRRSASRR